MNITELIHELELFKAREGDIEVCLYDHEATMFPICDRPIDTKDIAIEVQGHAIGAPWTDNRRVVLGKPSL